MAHTNNILGLTNKNVNQVNWYGTVYGYSALAMLINVVINIIAAFFIGFYSFYTFVGLTIVIAIVTSIVYLIGASIIAIRHG